MNKKVLICGLSAALLATAACGGTTTTPANSNTTKAATPTPASTTSPAANAAAQDFTLINATGVEIDKVFISPHDKDDWEEDILGQDTLPDGKSVDIKFNRAETAALWDLRIEDSKENSIEWENLNLLEINKLTLNYEDGKATAKID